MVTLAVAVSSHERDSTKGANGARLQRMDTRKIGGGLLAAVGIGVPLVAQMMGLTMNPWIGWPLLALFLLLAIVGLAFLFMPTKKPAEQTAPSPQVAGPAPIDQRVTSHNQSGGVTAHTVVNQAPEPRVIIGQYTVAGSTHSIEIEVDTPYPAAELIIVAYGTGISSIRSSPHRSGMHQCGWTGVRQDKAFTSILLAKGRYTIRVEKADAERVQLDFSFDTEIR